MRYSALLAAVITLFGINAHAGNLVGRNARSFDKRWYVESESPDYKVSVDKGTVEILSPKGLTMWFRKEMKGNIVIEYDARVMEEREGDRLSDLNCFWMASDPEEGSVFARSSERNGVFANCAQMQLYYVGYGGNHNSTTRFRRYYGKPNPAIVTEYKDPQHLLKANHWYHIKLVCKDGNVQYWIDGEQLVDYDDAAPLTHGWFGFRTTLSRTQFKNFTYSHTK